MQIHDIRRTNLRLLIDKRFDGVQRYLANAMGRSEAQITQWLNGGRNISETSARRMEHVAGEQPGWLDVSRSGTELLAGQVFAMTPALRPSLRAALEVLCTSLSVVQETERRESVGALLKACAIAGGDMSYIDAILATMRRANPPQANRERAQ